jgi:hypothetical protein
LRLDYSPLESALRSNSPNIPLYGRGKRQRLGVLLRKHGAPAPLLVKPCSKNYASAIFRRVLLRKRVAGATTARETLLEKLRFRYFSAGFRARKGFSHHELPKGYGRSR